MVRPGVKTMNFTEFYSKVQTMKQELEDKGINPEDVKIGYTRATGENIITAMSSEYTVASYFKW